MSLRDVHTPDIITSISLNLKDTLSPWTGCCSLHLTPGNQGAAACHYQLLCTSLVFYVNGLVIDTRVASFIKQTDSEIGQCRFHVLAIHSFYYYVVFFVWIHHILLSVHRLAHIVFVPRLGFS